MQGPKETEATGEAREAPELAVAPAAPPPAPAEPGPRGGEPAPEVPVPARPVAPVATAPELGPRDDPAPGPPVVPADDPPVPAMPFVPADDDEPAGGPPLLPAGDLRLAAGFVFASGLAASVAAVSSVGRGLDPVVGFALIDLALGIGLARGSRLAILLARARLLLAVVLGTYWLGTTHDLREGLLTFLFAVPLSLLLARRAGPWLRRAARVALVPCALLIAAETLVAAADLWFPVGSAEWGNRFVGEPVETLVGRQGGWRLEVAGGRWRPYRAEYLDRFVPSADAGLADPASGAEVLVFPGDGVLVDADGTALEDRIAESLHAGEVELEILEREPLRTPGFDAAELVQVGGVVGSTDVRGFVGFFVDEERSFEVWAIADEPEFPRLSLALREAAGALVPAAPDRRSAP